MKIIRPLRLLTCALVFTLASISLSSQASIITLTANINGAQANAGGGTGSIGTGIANMEFDDVSKEFSWDVSWSDLVGDVTVAHFHGPALPNQNAGIEVAISTASNPSSGNAILSDTQAADLLAGLWYVNIHSTTSPGGEIRGQVVSEPVVGVSSPGMLSILLLGVCGVLFSRKRFS